MVEAEGETVAAVLDDLDKSYPGLRFRVVDEQGRVRKHMKIFVNDEATRELSAPVGAGDEVTLMQALSGGS